jgi:hypothetical protein
LLPSGSEIPAELLFSQLSTTNSQLLEATELYNGLCQG